jgi:hypothetical protein
MVKRMVSNQKRSIFLIYLVAIFLVPRITVIQAVESTSQLEYGPYKVGWTRFQNISQTSGKTLPVMIFYPAIESIEDVEPNITEAPYPTLIYSPFLFGFSRLRSKYRTT